MGWSIFCEVCFKCGDCFGFCDMGNVRSNEMCLKSINMVMIVVMLMIVLVGIVVV